jgi:NADPH:quinone reductase-like Zn-dependent oxidoreductase
MYARWGGPERLELRDIAPGELASDCVRVAVAWSAINPLEWKVLSGMYRFLCRGRWPRRAGAEGSGRVIAVGSSVSTVKVGDCVAFGRDPMDTSQGAWAECVDVPLSRLSVLPADVDLREAATLPIAALTAMRMCRLAEVRENARILVTGASGGVGHLAVQIAHSSKARVVALGSERNRDFVLGLGATTFLDYARTPDLSTPGPFDAVLDCVNVISRDHAKKLLAPGGTYIDTDPRPLTMLVDAIRSLGPRRWKTVMVDMQREEMAAVLRLWREGRLRPFISAEFSLEQAAEGLRHVMRGHTLGKVVIRVASTPPFQT